MHYALFIVFKSYMITREKVLETSYINKNGRKPLVLQMLWGGDENSASVLDFGNETGKSHCKGRSNDHLLCQ